MWLPVLRTNNNWLDNAFNDFFDDSAMKRMNSTAPAVNVREDETAYIMEVAVPGIKKEFCRVDINNDGDLNIAIENKMEHKEDNKKERYLRREFSYTNYQQTYSLPDNVNKEGISAKVTDGVLTIQLPKIEKVEQKKKEIEFY